MAKKTLADLKNAFTNNTQTGGTGSSNYYFFWNMKVGERAILRFLPDLNTSNETGFLIESMHHKLTINGKTQKVPCLRMYGEECPVCAISQAFYKAKDEINGKKYWVKRSYKGQVLVVEDPLPLDPTTGENSKNQLRFVDISYQLYNIIKEAFGSDELEYIPYEFENGYDFIIKKSHPSKYDDYTIGTKFANRPRDLTAAEIAVAKANSVDLRSLLPKNPGQDKVQAWLDADLNGTTYEEENNGFDEDESADEPKAPVAPVVAPKVNKPKTPVQDDSADGEEDVDAMLAAIRNRYKKG